MKALPQTLVTFLEEKQKHFPDGILKGYVSKQ
jgi:hypothetical protein